jgi:hypothetical protein
VALDVLDEGESNGQTANENATARTIQTIQPQTTPPTPTPEQDELRVTRTRHAPGYYAKLQKGEAASIAIESLLEASELDLLDEVAHIERTLAAAEPEPTLAQALNGPNAVEWQEAINYEIGQLEKLETWEIVNAPRGANVIPCHFILAMKCGPDGEKLKLRARLVANGQRQQFGVNYFDTFAPTANMATIHTVLTMAAQCDWEIHQVDIKSAYLYASIQEEIYMRAPPGYLRDGQEGKVLKLKRSLPGLKQAGFEWAENSLECSRG